jgi:hypothetical protein
MTKIDRTFCSTSWEELFPTAWASTISDHCPLMLQGDTSAHRFKGFKFEAYWLKLPGFQEVVKEAWEKPIQAMDSIRRLHIKLSRSAKALKKWEKSNVGNIKLQLSIIKEVIWQLDRAQERRDLSQLEVNFRTRIKEIYLGLLALEKVRARQRLKLSNINHGDANTKLFYLHANGRKRKKHIQLLHTAQGLAFSHEDKEKEISRHFKELLGTKYSRDITLKWEELEYPHFNLDGLDDEITKEEVKRTIANMPKENAPSLDGCIGAFYVRCWDIVTTTNRHYGNGA